MLKGLRGGVHVRFLLQRREVREGQALDARIVQVTGKVDGFLVFAQRSGTLVHARVIVTELHHGKGALDGRGDRTVRMPFGSAQVGFPLDGGGGRVVFLVAGLREIEMRIRQARRNGGSVLPGTDRFVGLAKAHG